MGSEISDSKYLFEPRTVAVIGASPNPDKIGYKITDNIIAGGFTGKVYPVNPKGGEMLGVPIYKSVNDIPGEVDMAVITVAAKNCFDAVRECGVKKVKFLPIITSGFAEVGNLKEELDMITFARDHGMRVLGPNIFGVYMAKSKMNATFGAKTIRSGNVAIITQSGALGIAMMGKTAVEAVGLSAMLSVGNKADLDETDLLDYLVHDELTKVIMLYTEGVHHGQEFIECLKRTTRKKPVVMLKTGRSSRGAKAAASHTGGLAASDEILDAVMRQCGVLRAETLDEAFSWCKVFINSSYPTNDNTVILTNGGGIGVMTTDACEKYGVPMWDDQATMKSIFSKVTPDFGSTKNPIDLTGQARPADYDTALTEAKNQKDVGAVLGLYCETAVFEADDLIRMVDVNAKAYKEAGKPLIFSIVGGAKIENALAKLRNENAPVFPDTYQAADCLSVLYRQKRRMNAPADKVDEVKVDVTAVDKILDGARKDKRGFLLAHEGLALMNLCGVPMPKSSMAHNADEAAKAADKIGYPVVMKVVSRDILHKSDAGGVVLNVKDAEGAKKAYQKILASCKEYKADAVIEGIEVNEMVRQGVEAIIGARRDATFGPVIMCGMGGVLVEVLKDVAFRALPISRDEAKDMLGETKLDKMLKGVRGAGPRDLDAFLDVVIKLGSLLRACKGISDIEINPLVVYEKGQGARAVDVRVLLAK